MSQSTISRCFRAMVNMLYVKFLEILIWPSRAQVNDSMPSVFKSLYPSTRVVLDCTEVSIDKPADPLQASTFSSYKNRNTLQWLVWITPCSAVSFVSDALGGRTSDEEVTRLSDFYKKLDPGDAVMADRGFDLEDDLSKVGCQLNIPSFLGRRLQLSPEEVTETRRIASVHIHVERALQMERIKNFRILHHMHLPASILPLANRIFFACAFLTNYLPPLVTDKEEDDDSLWNHSLIRRTDCTWNKLIHFKWRFLWGNCAWCAWWWCHDRKFPTFFSRLHKMISKGEEQGETERERENER